MSRTSSALVLAGSVLALGTSAASAEADVVRTSATGFAIRHTATFGASPLDVYHAVVDDVGRWWDAAHTFSGDASNLSIDPRPQGCFCETFPDGGGATHLTVVNVEPGKLLRMVGGLGPLQGEAVTGVMTWAFEATPGGSKLTLTYQVAGTIDGELGTWSGPVDQVVGEQVRRLADYVSGTLR